MTGIVSGIVHRFDVRETGEVHKAGTEDRRTDGGGQALSQGGSGAGRSVAGAADDRHGVSLCSVSGELERMQNPARPGAQRFEQRPPTAGLSFSDCIGHFVFRAGLRAHEGRGLSPLPASITFPCHIGTVDLTLRSLTVAGAAPD
jgi:hypothetical protein